MRKTYSTTYDDDNGNRTNTGYATGDQDRLTNQPPRRRDAEKQRRQLDVRTSRRLRASAVLSVFKRRRHPKIAAWLGARNRSCFR